MQKLEVTNSKITQIREYKNNPELHSRMQVGKIAKYIQEFGFVNPVLAD